MNKTNRTPVIVTVERSASHQDVYHVTVDGKCASPLSQAIADVTDRLLKAGENHARYYRYSAV